MKCQINGGRVETVTDFIFLGSKITSDSDYSHKIKRCSFLERKAMTNLNSVLKSRDITLVSKDCTSQNCVFPIVMYGCESWTLKKTEHWITDTSNLWCWTRLHCTEIKQVNPKRNYPWIFIGRTGIEPETPVLWPPDMKTQFFGKRPWCWKRLKAEGEGDDRGWNGWMTSPTQWTWVWANSSRKWRTRKSSVLQFMGSQRVRHDLATEQLERSYWDVWVFLFLTSKCKRNQECGTIWWRFFKDHSGC